MTTHTDLIARLRVIANAIADGNYSELTMRIPAEPDRDADIVVMCSALAIEALEQQVAALTRAADTDYEQLYREANDQLAAAQARESRLRDAAKAVLEVGMGSDFEALNAAFAIPADDSTLMERLKQERERAVREYIEMLCHDEGYWCVVCGRHLPADKDGVIVHDDVPHPEDMTFDEEERPQ